MSTTHRTPEQLEADLGHQREQLAATVTQPPAHPSPDHPKELLS